MTTYSYSTKIGEKDAPAAGVGLPISTKHSIEICTFIRGKKLEKAKIMLSNVINEDAAVPFKRFTDGVGHRKGKIAGGRYPKKACTEILKLINSAQANAQFKGLSSSDLVLRHISAQKGTNTYRYGRRRRFAKRTTIEVVLSEVAAKKEAKPAKTETQPKATPKPEAEKAGPEQKQAEKQKLETSPAKTEQTQNQPKLEREVPKSRSEASRKLKPEGGKTEQ